jgi:aryl-alcohol dehydrogenase-like predicted oxidoreductase
MKKIQIKGIEMPVTQFVMGSMMLNVDKQAYSSELLDAYESIGGNAIDTARVYGPRGMKAIGAWFAERGNRERFALVAKGAHPDDEGPRIKKEAIEVDISESLEWMRTDYVDVFMLHRDDTALPVGHILELLQPLLEDGRAKALGVSNWTIGRLDEANRYATEHGLIGFACNSPNLSLAVPNEPRWAECVTAGPTDMAWHEMTQLPLLSWSSQAGGFFTGRFSPERRDDPEAVRVYYNEANWERLERARKLGAEKGVDANQIALAYVLGQPFPTCALIGPQTPEELYSSTFERKFELTPEEIRWLTEPGK